MSISATQRALMRQGAKEIIPIVLGIIPWGIVTGVAMVSCGLTRFEAIGMSLIVFAGSAQLAVLPLLLVQAPLWVMIATALVVNLRFIIFSASLAPHFNQLPRKWRWLFSYIMTDGVFALFINRFQPDDLLKHKEWYFLGASLVMWCAWQIASLLGILVGALIPESWSLEFAGSLALIALVVPMLNNSAMITAAVAASVVAVLAVNLPLKLGLIAAVLAGVAAGLMIENLPKDT